MMDNLSFGKKHITFIKLALNFFSEVSGFVRSCCDQHPGTCPGTSCTTSNCITLDDQVAQSKLFIKKSREMTTGVYKNLNHLFHLRCNAGERHQAACSHPG